jgi:hypothetical protein
VEDLTLPQPGEAAHHQHVREITRAAASRLAEDGIHLVQRGRRV